MNLNEAKKILNDNGYIIKESNTPVYVKAGEICILR